MKGEKLFIQNAKLFCIIAVNFSIDSYVQPKFSRDFEFNFAESIFVMSAKRKQKSFRITSKTVSCKNTFKSSHKDTNRERNYLLGKKCIFSC